MAHKDRKRHHAGCGQPKRGEQWPPRELLFRRGFSRAAQPLPEERHRLCRLFCLRRNSVQFGFTRCDLPFPLSGQTLRHTRIYGHGKGLGHVSDGGVVGEPTLQSLFREHRACLGAQVLDTRVKSRSPGLGLVELLLAASPLLERLFERRYLFYSGVAQKRFRGLVKDTFRVDPQRLRLPCIFQGLC